MLKKEIGLRIRDIRINMGLTKEKFASLLGISGQYLGIVERGNGSLSIDKLKTLCDLTNLSSDYILFGMEENKQNNTVTKLLSKLDEKEQLYAEKLLEVYFDSCNK